MIPQPEGGWKMQRVMTHPGAILREDFLVPLELSGGELALGLRTSDELVGEILQEHAPITPDFALRLALFFNTSAEWWLNMQMNHDLTKARLSSEQKLREDIQPFRKAA